MKKFVYKAKSRHGQPMQGVLEVENRDIAVAKLREQGFLVTSIRESINQEITLFQSRAPVKAKHLAVLCRQFSIELQTGLSLVQSLELLEEQSADKRLQKALGQIRLDVASGSSFTKSLDKHKDLFPHVFIHLVEAGEVAGALPEVLERLAIYYEREDELRKKISEALMYPGIITAVAGLMVLILLFFVLPMLIRNFSGFGVEPPRLTQIILAGRDWMVTHWYIVLFAIGVVVFSVKTYVNTTGGKKQWHSFTLNVPVLGNLNKMVVFSRFCRTMALLLRSGLSMVQSLEIIERLINNVIVNDALQTARLEVQRGQNLSTPMRAKKLFPTMLVQMVSVGEETGNLEKTLVQLSDFYDREVNYAVASFTKILEPIVMLILAVVVLFILISVYLPMMQMVTQL